MLRPYHQAAGFYTRAPGHEQSVGIAAAAARAPINRYSSSSGKKEMDVDSLRKTSEVLEKIDEAVAKCYVSHMAEAKFLQKFFRDTVYEVRSFLRSAKDLQFLDGARIKVEMLTAALANCLTYIECRSCTSVYEYIIKSVSESESTSSSKTTTSYSVTSNDLQEEAKAAVQEGVIEPVLVRVEVSWTPFLLDLRRTRDTVCCADAPPAAVMPPALLLLLFSH